MALDWCLVTAQVNSSDKNLHVAFGLDLVTEQEHDESLVAWLDHRIDTTLGRHPEQFGHRIPVGQAPSQWGGQTLQSDIIAHAVGQGLLLDTTIYSCKGQTQIISQEGDPRPSWGRWHSPRMTPAPACHSGIDDPQDCQVI